MVAGAMVALAACQQIQLPSDQCGPSDESVTPEGREVVLKAVAPGATKVKIDGLNLLWDNDDFISVCDGPDLTGYTTYKNVPFECVDANGSSATFIGKLSYHRGGDVIAFYPGDPDVVFPYPDTVKMWRREFQRLAEDTGMDREMFWMVAQGTDELYFKPVVGVLKFRLAQDDIASLEFVFDGVSQGDAEVTVYNMHKDVPSAEIQDTWNQSSNSVFVYPGGEDQVGARQTACFQKDKDYYLSVLPGTATSVKVLATKYEEYPTHLASKYSRVKSTRTLEIQPGVMNNLGALNFTKWFDEPIKDVTFPEMEGDTYLIWSDSPYFYCEQPYTSYCFADPAVARPALGIRSENPAVATVDGMWVYPAGLGETDITMWYPASAASPEEALESKTYHFVVRNAFSGGLLYNFEPYTYWDGTTALSGFVTCARALGFSLQTSLNWPNLNIGTTYYDGRDVVVPAAVRVGYNMYRVAGLYDAAFEDASPVSISFEEGPEYIGNYVFSNCQTRLIRLPASIRSVGSFGVLTNPYTSVQFADGRESNGYLTIDGYGVYAREKYFFANRGVQELVVPDGIKWITDGAISFTDCYSVELPASVNTVWYFNFCNYYGQSSYGTILNQLKVSCTAQDFDYAFRMMKEDVDLLFYYFDRNQTNLNRTTLIVSYPRSDTQFRADWDAYVSEKLAQIEAGTLESRKWFSGVRFEPTDSAEGNIKPFEPGVNYEDWQ